MFRFIIIAILLILYLILMIPVMLILLLISRYNNKLSSTIGQAMVRFIFKIILFIAGAKVEIKGLENIPKDGGVLFVSNHRSYFDILIAYAYTPKELGFISKSEMSKYILLKQWMYIVNCLFLDRKDIKKGMKTILEAIEKVKSGTSVWICPEGTRLKGDNQKELLEFKEGSFKIAEKAKAPIVPVILNNTGDIFERQFPKIKAVKVGIEYLPPIYMEELPKETVKKIGEYTRELIKDKLL